MTKKDDLLKKLPDYLKGNLSEKEKTDFEKKVAVSSDRDEIESLTQIWQKLEALPDAEPGDAINSRFNAMLAAYKAGQVQAREEVGFAAAFKHWLERWWPKQPAWQFSLAMALLFCGFLGGYLLSSPAEQTDIALLRNEVFGLRQMVATSLLQSQSSSERLRGVNYSYAVSRPDDATLQALLNTLNYDSNLNVRLAAVDAISQFYEREFIRRGILESLERQTSPLLQIALIELLEARQEKGSIKVLNTLKENKTIEQMVRSRAGKAIKQIK